MFSILADCYRGAYYQGLGIDVYETSLIEYHCIGTVKWHRPTDGELNGLVTREDEQIVVEEITMCFTRYIE